MRRGRVAAVIGLVALIVFGGLILWQGAELRDQANTDRSLARQAKALALSNKRLVLANKRLALANKEQAMENHRSLCLFYRLLGLDRPLTQEQRNALRPSQLMAVQDLISSCGTKGG